MASAAVVRPQLPEVTLHEPAQVQLGAAELQLKQLQREPVKHANLQSAMPRSGSLTLRGLTALPAGFLPPPTAQP